MIGGLIEWGCINVEGKVEGWGLGCGIDEGCCAYSWGTDVSKDKWDSGEGVADLVCVHKWRSESKGREGKGEECDIHRKKCEEIYNKRTRIYIYISLAVGSNYVDVVLFLRQITTWVSPEIDYEREFQGGLGLFQLFWDILILISGLVSVSTQS